MAHLILNLMLGSTLGPGGIGAFGMESFQSVGGRKLEDLACRDSRLWM